MDRETRRRRRQAAGRSGGIFELSPGAIDPWDIQYQEVLPVDWSADLDSNRPLLDDEDTQMIDNEVNEHVEDVTDYQGSSHNEIHTDVKETLNEDKDSFIDFMSDESPEIMRATKHTLLSALPIRLDLGRRKDSKERRGPLQHQRHQIPDTVNSLSLEAKQYQQRTLALEQVSSSTELTTAQSLTLKLHQVLSSTNGVPNQA